MSDIVDRLRVAASNNIVQAERETDSVGVPLTYAQAVSKRCVAAMHLEAADEILRLRAVIDAAQLAQAEVNRKLDVVLERIDQLQAR